MVLEPKELKLCHDVFEKEGWIFYRTTFGYVLSAIKREEINNEIAQAYSVKLNLFEMLFGWKNRALKVRVR